MREARGIVGFLAPLALLVGADGASAQVRGPDCVATAEARATEPRSTTFADVVSDDTDYSGVFVLSCAGGLEAFDYDLGVRVTADENPNRRHRGLDLNDDLGLDLRIRDLKIATDVGSESYLIFGYHALNTDPSYAFQPIGLFGDSADYSTFLDRTFERESSPMARFEHYFGDVLAAATLSENRRHDLGSLQFVTSAAFSVGNTDAQLLYRYDEELGSGAGGAFSTVIGEGLQLHGSAFVQRGSARRYHADAISGTLRFRTADDSPIGRHRLDADDLVLRAVIGGHYTFRSGHNLLVELIHDGEGMSDAEWGRYVDVVDFHRNAPAPAVARAGNLGFDASVLGSANMQNYAFARYSLGPRASNLSLSALVNLSDGSTRLTVDAFREIGDSVEIYGNVSMNSGCRTCDFGLLPERYSANLGLSLRF
ncbi:hypothetical protein [Salinarimonas sp.]|uniref:hypothetical protein n=1 Tax=Salinarimonas sp. TaxID=2766526 RepID=UPI0032D99684